MNTLSYRFSLDLQTSQSQISIPVLLGDTNRRLYINLTNGGVPYIIPDGSIATFVARKSDENTLFNSCIIENKTTIRYDFTPNTATEPGIVNCEVRLYDTNGKTITSPRFIMVVDSRVIYDDSILSEGEHTIIDQIMLEEVKREEGERIREDAEHTREEVFNNKMDATNIAIATCNTATENANKTAATIEAKLESGELDGHTPVKGIDYWTPKDISEIKSYVDDAILKGEW